jgi:uncharacterized protein (DUF302 family)
MSKKATDFLVECRNPKLFDQTIQQLGASVLIKNGYYIMRVFGNAGFLKFAIENQGYGKVIKQLEELI